MSAPEVYVESGLVVCRGAVADTLVEQLDAEAAALVAQNDGCRDSSSKRSPGTVWSADYAVADLNNFPAMQQMAVILDGGDPHTSLTINQQAPRAFQRFHGDMKLLPVAVVHVSGVGAIDFSPDLAVSLQEVDGVELVDGDLPIEPYSSIELLPGDIVVQMHPFKTHRGRNLGDDTRRTLAFHS